MRRRVLAWIASLGACVAAAAACASLDRLSTGDASSPDASDEAQADAAVTCTCTAPAPNGWSGPFVLYDGDPANVPACPAGVTATLHANADLIDAGPAQCAPCACGSPSGGCDLTSDAAAPVGAAYTGTSGPDACNGSLSRCGAGELLTPGACQNGGCLGSFSAVAYWPGNVPWTATCAASGGGASVPPVGWKRAVLGCGAPPVGGAGCSGNEICAPVLPPPFSPSMCILQSGDVACPGLPYAKKTVYNQAANDTRACSSCACTLPQPFCDQRILGFIDPGCTTPVPLTGPTNGAFVPANTACYAANAELQSFELKITPPTGSCSPSGGQPTGGVAPAGEVTVCCAQ